MSNFTHADQWSTYAEPEGTSVFYDAEVTVRAEYPNDEGRIGLCLTAEGGGDSVSLGIKTMEEVQEFLYTIAVRSRLVKDGDPLILMQKVSAE